MTNDIQVFQNNQFGSIRTVNINDEPWFIAKDLCQILGTETRDVKKILDLDEVDTIHITDSIGREQSTIVVNESGLYTLILRSRKEIAKPFRKWVTSEVLPSIRKNGGYITGQENLSPEQILANAILVAQKVIEDQKKQLEAAKPKIEFYDAVAGSKTAVDIGTVAKVLGIKGLGRNNLFELLRQKGILMNNNQPYQKYVDAGYFRVIEQKYTKPNGETCINIKTLVYQKGLDFIRRLVQTS